MRTAAITVVLAVVALGVAGCGGGSAADEGSPDATFCAAWPDQCNSGHPLIPGKPTRTYSTPDGFDCYVSQYRSGWPGDGGSPITNCYASSPKSLGGYCIYNGRHLPNTQSLPIPCQAANVALGGKYNPYAIH